MNIVKFSNWNNENVKICPCYLITFYKIIQQPHNINCPILHKVTCAQNIGDQLWPHFIRGKMNVCNKKKWKHN